MASSVGGTGGPSPVAANITPAARISVPDYIDYHMISDYELSQLSKPESGVLGTIGWAAFGGALGFALAAWRAILAAFENGEVKGEDAVSATLFAGLTATALICLILHFRSRSSLKELAATIRSRRKHTP